MIGRAETVPHRMMEYYLLACWTVISPVMILGILMFYCYDVIALTPPSYYKWDRSIGGWAQDDDGNQISFSYERGASATIWLLHLLTLIWIPFFLIKAFFKNGKFRISNFYNHPSILFS